MLGDTGSTPRRFAAPAWRASRVALAPPRREVPRFRARFVERVADAHDIAPEVAEQAGGKGAPGRRAAARVRDDQLRAVDPALGELSGQLARGTDVAERAPVV